MTTSPKGTARLQKDIYYRGYRLCITGDGHRANDVLIYKDDEHIETCGGVDFAKAQVDEWMIAP